MGTNARTSRGDLFKEIDAQLSTDLNWKDAEGDIAILCSEFPIAGKEYSEQAVKAMTSIYGLLIEKGFAIKQLGFIEARIEMFSKVKTIRSQIALNDRLTIEEIQKFSKGEPFKTRGSLELDFPYNQEELEHLSNGVFHENGVLQHYISNYETWPVQIMGEVKETSISVPVATLLQNAKRLKDGQVADTRVAFFGSKRPKNTKEMIVDELFEEFYVYNAVITDTEIIILSRAKLDLGSYIITGMSHYSNERVQVTEGTKLSAKLKFFFVNRAVNKVPKYISHKEFVASTKELGVSPENTFDFLLCFRKPNERTFTKLVQPNWYLRLMWAWTLHRTQGDVTAYPLHIFQVGQAGCGKSLTMDAHHAKHGEPKLPFSGASSTLKGLVPSFKHMPAKIGYICESLRFSYCDELIKGLLKKTSGQEDDTMQNVGILNDVLEHRKRTVQSGNSKCNIVSRSRIFAASNPIRNGENTIHKLLDTFDLSFLTRWLIYPQSKDHVNFIKNLTDEEMCQTQEWAVTELIWQGLVEFLQNISTTFDRKRVIEIYNSPLFLFDTRLKDHYEARHKHHILCLMDGIIKTRCFLNNIIDYTAIDEDYNILRTIWEQLVSSWIDPSAIRKVPLDRRIGYLPEKSQLAFGLLCSLKRPVMDSDMVGLAEKNNMTVDELQLAIHILRNYGMVIDQGNMIKPHYMGDED